MPMKRLPTSAAVLFVPAFLMLVPPVRAGQDGQEEAGAPEAPPEIDTRGLILREEGAFEGYTLIAPFSEDATLLLDLMQRASGEPPALLNSRVRQAETAIRAAWSASNAGEALEIRRENQRHLGGPAQACAPSYLFGLIGVTATLALPDGTTPLTPEELENLALARGYTAVRAPDGRLFLIETWDAPGSRPDRRSDFRLPEGARRIDKPAAFGLGQIPEGYVPYLAPQGTIHLFKDPRGASTFAPSALNPE